MVPEMIVRIFLPAALQKIEISKPTGAILTIFDEVWLFVRIYCSSTSISCSVARSLVSKMEGTPSNLAVLCHMFYRLLGLKIILMINQNYLILLLQ